MEKTYVDISINQSEDGESFYREDSSYGRILISEDNSFEGIIQDFCCPIQYLIFGKMEDRGETNTIKIIKCRRYDQEEPKYMEASQNGKFFMGQANESIGYQLDRDNVFFTKVSFYNPDSYRSIEDGEIERLEEEINDYHQQMGEQGKSFYKDFLGLPKKEVQKIIARN